MMPNGWRTLKLEDVVEKDAPIRYGVVQIGENTEDGIPIVPIKYINTIETSPLHKASKDIEGKYIKSRIKEGDVLLSVKGTIGGVGIVPKGFEGNIAREIARIRPSNEFYSLYIAMQLEAERTQKRIQNLTVGTTRREFSIHAVRSFCIEIPPLKEQQKIANIISTWNKAIKTTEDIIKKNKLQKRALMQQLLTGKKRLLDDSGKTFENAWESLKLNEICKISKGKQLNRSTLSNEGTYPVINGGITPSGYTESYNLEKNTITISEGGNSCGYIDIQRSNFWCGGHCYSLSDVSIDTEFLYQFLKYKERRIMSLRVGSGLPNIQKKAIEGVYISFPSIQEQQKISSVLTNIDKETEKYEQQLADLKQEKKALMQQLLTGKRRVSV